MAETQEVVLETEVQPANDLPEYLQGDDFAEITADEKSRNILSHYKTPQDAYKALVEKETLVRSNFRLPKKLGDEQIKELKSRLAEINKVPVNAEGYNLVRPEEIDEKLDFSEQFKMEIRAFAKERDIAPDTLQGLYEKALRGIKTSQDANEVVRNEQVEKSRGETVALMQKYLGPEEYKKVASENGLIDQFAKSRAMNEDEYNDLFDKLSETNLRNHPLLFKLIADGARMWHIMEGGGRTNLPGLAPTPGNKVISAEAKRMTDYPNTPVSLGGGKKD